MLYHVIPGILHYVFNYSMHLKPTKVVRKVSSWAIELPGEAAKGAPFTLSLGGKVGPGHDVTCKIKRLWAWGWSNLWQTWNMKGERWFNCFRILEDDAVPMSFLPPRHGDRGDSEEPMGCDTVAGAMSSVNIPEQNVAFLEHSAKAAKINECCVHGPRT